MLTYLLRVSNVFSFLDLATIEQGPYQGSFQLKYEIQGAHTIILTLDDFDEAGEGVAWEYAGLFEEDDEIFSFSGHYCPVEDWIGTSLGQILTRLGFALED